MVTVSSAVPIRIKVHLSRTVLFGLLMLEIHYTAQAVNLERTILKGKYYEAALHSTVY